MVEVLSKIIFNNALASLKSDFSINVFSKILQRKELLIIKMMRLLYRQPKTASCSHLSTFSCSAALQILNMKKVSFLLIFELISFSKQILE